MVVGAHIIIYSTFSSEQTFAELVENLVVILTVSGESFENRVVLSQQSLWNVLLFGKKTVSVPVEPSPPLSIAGSCTTLSFSLTLCGSSCVG